MIEGQLPTFPRPCPIPGHPQDDEPAEFKSDSAWARLRAWHLHAPAERLPLPLVLFTWPVAWMLHAWHVEGHVITYTVAGTVLAVWLTWQRHQRKSPHLRLAATEAALVAAAVGGWMAAAVTSGPLGWPAHLLTWIYLAGAIGGYVWLRRHPAVRAARARRDEETAWTARKTWWHQVAHRLGLDGWHLVKANETLLGEELFIRTSPDGKLASQVIHDAAHIAERLAGILGLPYGRIDVDQTGTPFELRISIRSDDPWKEPIWHPALAGDSPHAELMPVPASIRQPLVLGIDPETGEPLTLKLWDKRGAKVVQVLAKKDGGKTTLFDTLTERITACPDARLLQVNLSKALEDGWWAPLAEANALDGDMQRALLILQFAYDAIRQRPRGGRETRVHQPTPAEPLFVLKIDEIDAVAGNQEAKRLLGLIASKCRSEGVALVLGGQRATVQWTGGSDVRANADIAVWGKFVRGSEKNHVAGAEANLPDMGEYGGGHPGVFGICELPFNGSCQKGRTFYWGEEAPGLQRLVAERAATRAPYVLEPALATLEGTWAQITGAAPVTPASQEHPQEQPGNAIRERLAKVHAANEERPLPAQAEALPEVPGVPAGVTADLLRILSSSRLSSAAAGQALGMSKSAAHRYLAALRDAGVVEMAGIGKSVKWRLARRAAVGAEPPDRVTIEEVARAMHDGLVEATEKQRAVLERAWEIAHRPHLTLVPPLPDDDEGNGQ
jgi:DNA-binding transcriptional ArsR family regulator